MRCRKNLPYLERTMRINWSKVLLGGVIAGIVLIALDFVNHSYVLGPKSVAELDAFKPGLSATMNTSSGMVGYLVADILMGIILIWLYAAIRPRFGPGVGTAIKAVIPVWIVSGIAYYGWVPMGMMSSTLWLSFAVAELVIMSLAACAGARFYSEETPA
jgi:hypothetical protein